MNNFDFKILDYICSADEPVRMSDITAKFGTAGHEAAVQLRKDRLISWDLCDDDPFCHDEYGIVEPTDKGILEHQRYSYDSQLSLRELWINRILGYIAGISSTVIVYLITEYLLPLIGL